MYFKTCWGLGLSGSSVASHVRHVGEPRGVALVHARATASGERLDGDLQAQAGALLAHLQHCLCGGSTNSLGVAAGVDDAVPESWLSKAAYSSQAKGC